MNEQVLQMGPDANLVGVATLPDGPARPVAVLFLNAGVVHRIGPHRISVKLARQLAQMGYICVRFDLSGVGDSQTPRAATDFRQQGVSDVQSAMDHVQRHHNVTSFALFGICSGAVNAHAAAVADRRVVGAFMADGYIYPTLSTHLHYLRLKWREGRLRRGLRRIGRRVLKAVRTRAGRRTAENGDSDPTIFPKTRAQFAADIDGLARRGVKVELMFSGSILHDYSYAGQARDTFGPEFVGRIPCHFEPAVDHTVTSQAAQRRLAELVSAWVARF